MTTKVIEVPVNALSAARAIEALRDAIATGRAPLPAGASVVSIEESYHEFAPRPFARVAVDADELVADATYQRSCYVLALTIERIDRVSTPMFNRLIAKTTTDAKCLHRQRRANGVQDLFCVRVLFHAGNHLHDVHPEGAHWDAARRFWVYGKAVLGEAARREAAAHRAGFASYADEERHNR